MAVRHAVVAMTPEYRSSDLVKAETCRHCGEPIMKFSIAQGEQWLGKAQAENVVGGANTRSQAP
jgi:hypothetical protein